MNDRLQPLSESGTALARMEDSPPRREFHELWFALARREWRSVVFVPADVGQSVAPIATGLAQVGKQLHDYPVTLFVMANPADYWPAVQIVKTAASTDDTSGVMHRDSSGSFDYAAAVQVAAAAANSKQSSERTSTGKVIVAIQPVIAEPLGLSVTQAADVVVVCVEMGRTSLASARRTIELVGRERIAGCFLVRD